VNGRLYRVCAARDIPPLEGRSVTVGGKRVAIFNAAGGYAALDATCPHKAGPLGDGLLADACVVCPLHGWRIDLKTGAVVDGGEGRIGTYEVVEREGELFVELPAPVEARA
jgi:nitrite reductase (NADH) small subunit